MLLKYYLPLLYLNSNIEIHKLRTAEEQNKLYQQFKF